MSENRQRQHQVSVRLLPDEWECLAALADSEAVSPGELLRRALFAEPAVSADTGLREDLAALADNATRNVIFPNELRAVLSAHPAPQTVNEATIGVETLRAAIRDGNHYKKQRDEARAENEKWQQRTDTCLRQRHAHIEERDEARDALRTLVELKDGPRDANYRASKDAAWDAARALTAALETEAGE